MALVLAVRGIRDGDMFEILHHRTDHVMRVWFGFGFGLRLRLDLVRLYVRVLVRFLELVLIIVNVQLVRL